jgi:hypothetical protein
MGQGITGLGRTYSDVRVIITSFSLAAFIAAAASISGGKLREPQDTTFGRTDGGRSGIQEMKVWAPGLKQLRDRDNIMLQNILDLTDWRGLHMTATPGSVQRSTELAIEGRSQGSVFKVTSTVSIHNTPSWSQLEEIKRFLANSLLLELKIIQISAEEARSGGGTQGRITFTIQVRNRHRATETTRELWEWLQSSLEGILVEEGLWRGGGHGDAHVNGCRISQRPLPGEVDGGDGRGAPPFALHPSPQGSRKGREGQLEEWAQRPHKVDLMGTILPQCRHSKWRSSAGKCGNAG